MSDESADRFRDNVDAVGAAMDALRAERDRLANHLARALNEARSAKADNARLRKPLVNLIEAIDSGNLEMNSPDIDLIDGIPPSPWHEHLIHHIRAALAPTTEGKDG